MSAVRQIGIKMVVDGQSVATALPKTARVRCADTDQARDHQRGQVTQASPMAASSSPSGQLGYATNTSRPVTQSKEYHFMGGYYSGRAHDGK